MPKKYCVVVSRTGCVFVEADSDSEAMDIANHQTTDTINWSDDWDATDAYEEESDSEYTYISEKAFE